MAGQYRQAGKRTVHTIINYLSHKGFKCNRLQNLSKKPEIFVRKLKYHFQKKPKKQSGLKTKSYQE